MGKQIVANALQGNTPKIAFLRVENPDGSVVFDGKEDGIWGNKELLNAKCTIVNGNNGFVCLLHNTFHL